MLNGESFTADTVNLCKQWYSSLIGWDVTDGVEWRRIRRKGTRDDEGILKIELFMDERKNYHHRFLFVEIIKKFSHYELNRRY